MAHPNVHANEVTSATAADSRMTQARIRLKIPKSYYQEPVLSRLVSHHGVTINITALNELDLEMWQGADQENDGW